MGNKEWLEVLKRLGIAYSAARFVGLPSEWSYTAKVGRKIAMFRGAVSITDPEQVIPILPTEHIAETVKAAHVDARAAVRAALDATEAEEAIDNG
jgi:hypothetical protein